MRYLALGLGSFWGAIALHAQVRPETFWPLSFIASLGSLILMAVSVADEHTNHPGEG